MPTENLDDIGKGNTLFKIDLNFFNEDGSPRNMLGHLIFMQFRYGSSDGDMVADLHIGTGINWVDQAAGIAETLQIDSLNWALGTYHYDVRVKETATSALYTTSSGTMNVVEIVTKRSE